MNVLMVERKDFVRPEICLSNLKASYSRYIAFQDFVWTPFRGGIIILKNRYGPEGLFFAE
jgi:hypothetical protein